MVKSPPPISDPLPEPGYQAAKNRLWNNYQQQYYPAFTEFRHKTFDEALHLAKNPAKNYSKSIKKLVHMRNEYVTTATNFFREYVEGLTKAWIDEKLANQGVDLADAATKAAHLAQTEKAGPAPKHILTRKEAKAKIASKARSKKK